MSDRAWVWAVIIGTFVIGIWIGAMATFEYCTSQTRQWVAIERENEIHLQELQVRNDGELVVGFGARQFECFAAPDRNPAPATTGGKP